tara:strand:+ start:2068 stop:3504 length:1437 start_codon:yes stop_codon:yes gene_type:complete
MKEQMTRRLPYRKDSEYLITAIGALPGAFCLDSGLTRYPQGRYDILTALPSATVNVKRNTSDGTTRLYERHYDESDWQALTCTDWRQVAEELLAAHQPSAEDKEALAGLPFCGGLLGALAYSADQTQKSGWRADHDDPLAQALLRLPELHIGLYEWAVIVDHEKQQSTLFFLSRCPSAIRERAEECLSDLERSTSRPRFSLLHAFTAATSHQDYQLAFARLNHWIQAGDCYQANLAMGFQAGFRGEPLGAYLRLRQTSRSPFSGFVRTENASILSLSPERFLSVHGRQVTTQPIKGTRRRHPNAEEDESARLALRDSDKDQAENLMIVDLMRNDLGKVCVTGSVKTPELFAVHSFTHVHHLISTVTGELPADVSPLALLQHCFPGGSITGAPKIRAMQIISELEKRPRSFYCGSLFYLDHNGNFDSSICIRTLVCADDMIYCWGGGGVVADSDCDTEYQECHDKVTALMHSLETTGAD